VVATQRWSSRYPLLLRGRGRTLPAGEGSGETRQLVSQWGPGSHRAQRQGPGRSVVTVGEADHYSAIKEMALDQSGNRGNQFGYPVRTFTPEDADTRAPESVLPQRLVEVDLYDAGKVILLKEDHDRILSESGVYNAASYKEAVLAAKKARGEEWQTERGPDSELTQGMEAGTPDTDNGQ